MGERRCTWMESCIRSSTSRGWLMVGQVEDRLRTLRARHEITASGGTWSAPTRHAGEGRYPRLAFAAAREVVDTGLRRHDAVGVRAPRGDSVISRQALSGGSP